MGALDGSWAKLERAKAHIDTLRAEISETTEGELNLPLRRQYEPEHAAVVWRIESVPEIRDSWGLLVGDALHNLRCALDHLWWQLALKHLGREPTKREAKKVQFPIVDASTAWSGHRFLKYIDPEHAAKVEPMQPYHPAPPNSLNPLYALRELSNIDKHRVLHVITRLPHELIFRAPTPEKFHDCYADNPVRVVFGSSMGGEARPNDEVFRIHVTPTGQNPDVEVNPNLTAHIAFHDNWNPIDTLDGIGAQVAIILEAFEPLL